MLATKISPLYVAAASNLLRFCRVCHRVAAVSPPVSVVFPTDGWQSLVKTPSLPHLELLRRSFAIESSVASLLAFPAALFTAIDRSGHHEFGGTFSLRSRCLSMASYSTVRALDRRGWKRRGVCTQLVFSMHIFVQPLYLIVLGEASGSVHICKHDRCVFVKRLVWMLHTASDFSNHLCSVPTKQILLSKFLIKFFPCDPGCSIVAIPEQSFTPDSGNPIMSCSPENPYPCSSTLSRNKRGSLPSK